MGGGVTLARLGGAANVTGAFCPAPAAAPAAADETPGAAPSAEVVGENCASRTSTSLFSVSSLLIAYASAER